MFAFLAPRSPIIVRFLSTLHIITFISNVSALPVFVDFGDKMNGNQTKLKLQVSDHIKSFTD